MSLLKLGRWERSSSVVDGCIDYTGKTEDDLIIRLWGAAPPGSCRVVEEEIEVPARIEKRRRLICGDSDVVAPVEAVNSDEIQF
jgi:hypothetical protein